MEEVVSSNLTRSTKTFHRPKLYCSRAEILIPPPRISEEQPKNLVRGFKLQHRAVDLFRQQVNEPIPTLADVTNTLFQLT